jgi:hypothetical protein
MGVDPPKLCAQGSGFYYYSNGGSPTYMECQTGSVTCSNISSSIADLGLTFGYINPVGPILPPGSEPNGVIILHGGGGGTSTESFDIADAYFRAGYEVVQVKWSDDWEMISDPIPWGTNGNIQWAACRPATFFNYIYQTFYKPLTQPPNQNYPGGMCALGDSAGSAAIGYSLAYYGARNFLDNVELISGPVLSDIKEGCGVAAGIGANDPINVCGTGDFWCSLGTGGTSWTLGPEYVSGVQGTVGKWTNDLTCENSSGTSGSSETTWLNQSIVDQSTGGASQGAIPTFTYSNTSIAGWLCRSVIDDVNGVSYNCAANVNGNPNGNSNYCPNNSSSQGELFYDVIGASTQQPAHYAVYPADNCVTAEGVTAGNVPGYQQLIFNGTVSGFNAIVDDMVGLAPNISQECKRRHF